MANFSDEMFICLSNPCQWVVPVRFLRVESAYFIFSLNCRFSLIFLNSFIIEICRSWGPFAKGGFHPFFFCHYTHLLKCVLWQRKVWLSLINKLESFETERQWTMQSHPGAKILNYLEHKSHRHCLVGQGKYTLYLIGNKICFPLKLSVKLDMQLMRQLL